MSTCISQHGEYSDHVPRDADHTCTRCGVLDEDGLLDQLRGLRQELDEARAEIERLKAHEEIRAQAIRDHQRRLIAADAALARAASLEAERDEARAEGRREAIAVVRTALDAAMAEPRPISTASAEVRGASKVPGVALDHASRAGRITALGGLLATLEGTQP